MFEWLKQKIGQVNTILDLGIISGILLAMATMMVYVYKIALLTIVIRVPFSLSRAVVDIQNIDFLFGGMYILLFLLVQSVYYFYLFKKKYIKKFFIITTIIYVVVFRVVLNFNLRECVWFLFFIQIMLPLATWSISTMVRDKNLEFLKRDGFNENRSDKSKIMVFLVLVMVYLTCAVVIAGIMAFIFATFPKRMMLANEKVVLYTASEQFLVADYTIKDDYIIYKADSMQLLDKSGVKIKFTPRVLLIKGEE